MYGLLLFLTVYFIFYKFTFINSKIYFNLRDHHSKTYLRKNKPRSFKDKIFYTCYKKSINKFVYWLNVVCCIAILLTFVIGMVTWIAKLESIAYMEPIITALCFIFLLMGETAFVIRLWDAALGVEQGTIPCFAKKKRAGRETCPSLAPIDAAGV